jgi:hypothetical protein
VSSKNSKSFNGHVYDISYKRLKLKRREKIILQRLLGFLIRNDKPFPFSRKSLSELTGYSKSSLDEALNLLETYRLIQRIGCTNGVKFIKGSILIKICSLAQIRINKVLVNNCTLAQKLGELDPISPVSGNIKTSSSLKHKEKGFLSQEDLQQIAWYEKNPQMKIDEKDKWLFEMFNRIGKRNKMV